MRILAWDIERVPAAGYHWGLYDQNIGIGQLIEHGEMVSFAARWVGEPKKNAVFYSTHHNGKFEMLNALWDLHNEADRSEERRVGKERRSESATQREVN